MAVLQHSPNFIRTLELRVCAEETAQEVEEQFLFLIFKLI
jgi:hypothetical protein